ncbi:hypothetical protein [Micromonospora sp. MA102]|uniref:hypothetical protein n=1 Tax=Micromonospora sp. MA102 TaxID=2952755 RepID=UPI0021C8B894|nr:hypothetical protein [Micromonospora sp. MA102]
MTGSDRQTYGLLYDDTDFVAYAAYNRVMSQRDRAFGAGPQSWRRKLAKAAAEGVAATPAGSNTVA